MSEFIRDWVYPVVVTLVLTGIVGLIAVGLVTVPVWGLEVMLG